MTLLATRPNCSLIFLFAVLLISAAITEGVGEEGIQEVTFWHKPRRLMIGSTMPTCTYNECRGCRYKCMAEQIPVEGNDPINSAYHYRCVCHRSS